jgi:hypothetical protein
MSNPASSEEAVRKFFDCYSSGHPENFDQCVARDYVDYGHEPPGIGPDGARDDYESAIKMVGGLVPYTIDALVVDGDMVATSWTGALPNGNDLKGLSLFRVTGGMLRSTHHELIGGLPG